MSRSRTTARDGADRRAGAGSRRTRASGVAGDASVADMKRFHFAELAFSGHAVHPLPTGYTGEDGFEIFCRWEDAPVLWKPRNGGATPAGLGARDVLRLEAAYPLYGHELDAETSPFESGVGWAVKMAKAISSGAQACSRAAAAAPQTGRPADGRAGDPARALSRSRRGRRADRGRHQRDLVPDGESRHRDGAA